jgi:hypothetical protein
MTDVDCHFVDILPAIFPLSDIGPSQMNALLVSLLSTGLLAFSAVVHADPPPIEQAPTDVEGYIRCVQDTYASNQWQAGSIARCRASNPAVRSLREGDYVSVTFSLGQNQLYEKSRKQWIDFDKALRVQLLSKKLGELFQIANPMTAYSFQRVASDLDARFAELNEAPFSWYPATKAPYTTANGLSLAPLHNAELAQFTHCLENATARLSTSSISRTAFDTNVTACSGEISARNSDGSKALYQPQAFSSVAERVWAPIASQQAQAQEAERQRLEKEEAESWPNRLKVLLKLAFNWGLVIGVLFFAWSLLRRRRRDLEDDTYENRPPRKRGNDRRERNEDDAYENRQPRERKQADRKLNISDFEGGKYRQLGPLTFKHRCASCNHWSGPRTPHPVNNYKYVKLNAKGNCTKKRNGSPYGMKRDMDGFNCKDYSEIRY